MSFNLPVRLTMCFLFVVRRGLHRNQIKRQSQLAIITNANGHTAMMTPLRLLFLLKIVLLVSAAKLYHHPVLADVGVQVVDDSVQVADDRDQSDTSTRNTCTWETRDECEDGYAYRDPHLKPMTVHLEGEDDSIFYAYVDPDLATAYNATPGSVTPLKTSFTGMYAKFINLSPNKVQVFWEKSAGGQRSFMSELAPFSCGSTASYPTHRFVVVDANTQNDLVTWIVTQDNSLYHYDPYQSLEAARKALKDSDYGLYKMHYHTLEFNKQYEAFTGRQYLPVWKRDAPHLPMWPADSFGQTHVVTTRETQLESLPPPEIANAKIGKTGAKDSERLQLVPYRKNPDEEPLQLNMTVVSVMPRIFEVRNFFSAAEADHILELATGMKLGASSVGANSNSRTSSDTRTSRNSWIYRERSVIVDVLHRRAADLLQINEALFRHRANTPGEREFLPGRTGPITEPLQLVHYDLGQQYTPHFDFFPPEMNAEDQPTRFATLLLYLNEGMTGGETSFPRWVNGETREVLQVKPELGKAVLFYNQLPDGNYDDRSQHAAKPLLKGEKWMTNFWVWDPYNAKEAHS